MGLGIWFHRLLKHTPVFSRPPPNCKAGYVAHTLGLSFLKESVPKIQEPHPVPGGLQPTILSTSSQCQAPNPLSFLPLSKPFLLSSPQKEADVP